MANIMRCCQCTTNWKTEETDLRFEVFKVSFDGPSGYPSQYRGASYEWRYSSGTPGDGRIVVDVGQAKTVIKEAPNSSCDCINSCGGNPGENSYIDETVEYGGNYTKSYPGYWRKTSGPASAPNTVNGVHNIVYARQFYKTRFLQNWSNSHLCGNICFSCNGVTEYDNINSVFNGWKAWTPDG